MQSFPGTIPFIPVPMKTNILGPHFRLVRGNEKSYFIIVERVQEQKWGQWSSQSGDRVASVTCKCNFMEILAFVSCQM